MRASRTAPVVVASWLLVLGPSSAQAQPEPPRAPAAASTAIPAPRPAGGAAGAGPATASPAGAGATGPAAAPNAARRIRFLENQLRATERALGLMRAELDALKQGQPSPLPAASPQTTGARPAPAAGGGKQAERRPPAPPGPGGTRTARGPARETGPDELSRAEEEAPAPDQEVPDFTPGFLRAARAVLIRKGALEVDPSLRYQHNSTNVLNVEGLDVIESIFIGRFEIGKVKRDQLRPTLSFRYGATDRLQLNLEIPYVQTWTREFLPPQIQREPARDGERKTANGGIGDVTFGFSYHLWQESETLPDIILSAGVKTDTGDGPFDVGVFEASTGTGFWGGTVGLSFLKVSDPGALFGNIGYFYHLADKVGRVKIDPADSVQWGIGYSLALNPYLSLTTSVNGRFTNKLRIAGDSVPGSEQTVANLSLGITYGYGINRAFDLAFGLGITDDSPDFSLALSMPFTYNVGNLLDYVF